MENEKNMLSIRTYSKGLMVSMPQENYFSLNVKTINENHFSMSKALIMEAYRLVNQQMVLVLGCGHCKEIPIRDMVDALHMDMVDLDEGTLQELRGDLMSIGINLKKVSFHSEDITGSIAPLSEEAEKALKASSDAHKSLTILSNIIGNARPDFWTPTAKYPYNLVLCSLLLTQLQAFILSKIERIFIETFPESKDILRTHQDWIDAKFGFSRRLENGFVTHLKSLAAIEAIIYVSDTVRVWFTERIRDDLFLTEGYWLTLKTNRLADYFDSSYEIIKQNSWLWFVPNSESNPGGKLYEVQALILRHIRT
jgi:hypothetical protein